VDNQKSTDVSVESQYSVDQLVEDVRFIRERSFAKNPRSRTGVVAGQFLILLRQLQKGERPHRRSLRGFFRFISRDPESFREAA
jgi:hypothetical protein